MDTFLASVLVLSLVGREHEQIVKDEDKVQVSGTSPDRKAAAFTPTQMPRFTAGGSPYGCGSFFSRVCVCHRIRCRGLLAVLLRKRTVPIQGEIATP